MKFEDFDLDRLERGSKAKDWLDLEPSQDGVDCRLPLLYARSGSDGPTLLVLSGVHGDEYEGPETIPKVLQEIEPKELKGTLFCIPVCNVPAYRAIQRSSPVDGLNLARVFPGNRTGSITERIAYWLHHKAIQHADFLVDLHSGGMMYDIPTLVGYPDLGDDAGRRSREGSLAFGAPVLWNHPEVSSGRTISSATDFGIPSLYTEAPGGGYARPEDVECFTRGVLNVMKYLGMLEGDPQSEPPELDLYGAGNMDEVLEATVAGFFRPEVALLDRIEQGQRIGSVRDYHGEVVQDLVADASGIVIMLRRFHHVEPGDGLAHITQIRDLTSEN